VLTGSKAGRARLFLCELGGAVMKLTEGWSGRFGAAKTARVRPYEAWEGRAETPKLTENRRLPYRIEPPKERRDKLAWERRVDPKVAALQVSHKINRAVSRLFDPPAAYDPATNLRLPKVVVDPAAHVAALFHWRRPATGQLTRREETHTTAAKIGPAAPPPPSVSCVRPEIGRRGRAERYSVPQNDPAIEHKVLVQAKDGSRLVKAVRREIKAEQPTTPILTSARR
jgi:hypothetical protein